MNAATPDIPLPDLPEELNHDSMPALLMRVVLAVVLVGVTVGFCLKAADLNTVAEPGVVMKLPDQVGSFFGKSQDMSEAEKRILPGDTVMVRMLYENVSGDQISCSVVLSGGEKRSIHRPEICLPAQGWSIGGGNIVPIPLKSGRTLEVMNLDLRRQVEVRPNVFRPISSEFFYWFIGKDRTTPKHMVRIFQTSWDRVFHRINHRWAYVIITAVNSDSLRPGGKNAEQTKEMMEKFVRDVVPYFQKSEMTGAH